MSEKTRKSGGTFESKCVDCDHRYRCRSGLTDNADAAYSANCECAPCKNYPFRFKKILADDDLTYYDIKTCPTYVQQPA